MAKTKTSKKQKPFSIEDMEAVTLKKGVKTYPHNPGKNLRDVEFIKTAVMDALFDGDIEAAKEILKAHYEALDLEKTLARVPMSKRTFYDSLSPKGNPTAKTLAKIMSGLKRPVMR